MPSEQTIEPTKSTLKIADPVANLGQVDYRANPSAGNHDERGTPPSYDHPIEPDAHPVQPWTDQTWVAADEATDATRFRGINSPQQQAEYHLSPNPRGDWQGWSPDKAPS